MSVWWKGCLKFCLVTWAQTLALILHTEPYEAGILPTPSTLKSSWHSETAVKEFRVFPLTPTGDVGILAALKVKWILTSLQLTHLPYISTVCNVHNGNFNLIVNLTKECRTPCTTWYMLLNIITTRNDCSQWNLEGPIIGAFVCLKAICPFSPSG